MLTAKYKGKTIVTKGEIKEGDIYPDFCCQGHGWKVFLLISDFDPKGVGIWGRCLNPGDCQSASPTQPEDKRSSIEAEDFWEWLSDENQIKSEMHEQLIDMIWIGNMFNWMPPINWPFANETKWLREQL